MGKSKRKRKITIFCSIEGIRSEATLLEYLKEIYSDPESMSFPDNPKKGGNPDRILHFAIENMHNYVRSFAWIDEDVNLKVESRKKLAQCWALNEEETRGMLVCPLREIQSKFNPKNKKPALIVSHPVCVESLILKILGRVPVYSVFDESKRAEQIQNSKSALTSILAKVAPIDYYRQALSKEILEGRRKLIPELDLLIQMVSK